jgi:hypothetical protein
MSDWIDELADSLGEPHLTAQETAAILRLARDVAHGVERKLAPLSAFLVGRAAGRRAADGMSADEAFRGAVESARARIPDQPAVTEAGEGGPPDG